MSDPIELSTTWASRLPDRVLRAVDLGGHAGENQLQREYEVVLGHIGIRVLRCFEQRAGE